MHTINLSIYVTTCGGRFRPGSGAPTEESGRGDYVKIEEEEEEIALSYSQSTTDQRNPYGQGEGRGQSQGKGSTSNAEHYPGWGVQGAGGGEGPVGGVPGMGKGRERRV